MTFAFSLDALDTPPGPLISGALYARFEDLPKVDIVYSSGSAVPGFILDIPDGAQYVLGTITVGLPASNGAFLLDVINPSVPDENNGARIDSGFLDRTTLHTVFQNLFGEPLSLVVGEGGGGCESDIECDDGVFCNGAETCDTGTGECLPGTTVDCDDGVDCTVDSCNEGTDSCDNVVDDGFCDDGLGCNGAETCDASGGCQDGTPVDCDDGVDCTVDSCDEASGTCDNVPDDGFCDDGLFCNGAETCDAVLGCQDGTPVDCDDGVDCTIDSCNEETDTCDHDAFDCEAAAFLDIKPGSCPNPVNPRSKGVVPVALVGSTSFDVTVVDAASLTLARADGVGGSIAPLSDARRARVGDVATPFVGESCDCHESGGDGVLDLSLKFSTLDMSWALELDTLARGTIVELVLRGALLDGTTFEARDCIVIPGKNRESRGARGSTGGQK